MFTERRSTQDRRRFDGGPPEGCAERRQSDDRRSLHAHVEEYESFHEEHFRGIKVVTHVKLLS